jgi:hypothetical protein
VSKKTIWFLGANPQDSNLGVRFFESQDCIQRLKEHSPNVYGNVEPGSFTVDGTITGIKVETMADVVENSGDQGQQGQQPQGQRTRQTETA